MIRLKIYAAAVAGFVALMVGAFFRGKSQAKEEARDKANQDHIETRDRIDNAETSDNADDARDWLHNRKL